MTLTLILLLALGLGGWGLALRLKRLGRGEAERDALGKLTEAQRAQLDAAMRAPVDKRELVGRLRKDGL